MKDKDTLRVQARLRKQRQRAKSVTSCVTLTGVTDNSVTHPVMRFLVPGEDRKRMERIVESLKNHHQLDNVYLGCGKTSLPMGMVGGMLEATVI